MSLATHASRNSGTRRVDFWDGEPDSTRYPNGAHTFEAAKGCRLIFSASIEFFFVGEGSWTEVEMTITNKGDPDGDAVCAEVEMSESQVSGCASIQTC